MRRTILFLGACTSFLSVAFAFGPARSHADEDDKFLTEWRYPEAKVVVSGGSGAGGRAATSSAIMRTKDAYADVVKFYEKKLGESLGRSGTITVAKGDIPTGNATFLQEDLADRPMKVRIFVQHRPSSSLSVVISRADGEQETHIAWTYFRP